VWDGRVIPLNALPIELRPEDAVEAAYAPEVEALAHAARLRETALVECDPDLAPFLYQALRARLADRAAGSALSTIYVSGQEPERQRLGAGLELELRPGSLSERLLRELGRLLRESDANRLLVVAHFELLAPSTPSGDAARAAREVAALLQDHPGVPVLALHAPDVLIPQALADAFARRGAVGAVSLARLRHLVTRREARKLDVERFDPETLHAHVEGLNALELRRALVRVRERIDFDPRHAVSRDALLEELAALPRRAREPRPLLEGPATTEVEWRLRRT
jgi:cell division protease FtsH